MDRSAGDLARRTLDWSGRVEGFQRPGRRGSAADEVVRAPNFKSVAVVLNSPAMQLYRYRPDSKASLLPDLPDAQPTKGSPVRPVFGAIETRVGSCGGEA